MKSSSSDAPTLHKKGQKIRARTKLKQPYGTAALDPFPLSRCLLPQISAPALPRTSRKALQPRLFGPIVKLTCLSRPVFVSSNASDRILRGVAHCESHNGTTRIAENVPIGRPVRLTLPGPFHNAVSPGRFCICSMPVNICDINRQYIRTKGNSIRFLLSGTKRKSLGIREE